MIKQTNHPAILRVILFLWQLGQNWLKQRRAAELEKLQEQLTQAQWKNSMQQKTHEADLAAGYNLSHFNTMQ